MPLSQTVNPNDSLAALRQAVEPVVVSGIGDTTTVDDVSALEVFGELTRLADPVTGPSPYFDWILTGNVFYSVSVLAIFAGFCMLLYYFMPYALTVVNSFRGTLYIEKILDEHNHIFETFRRLVILIGLVMTGLLVIRYTDAVWGRDIGGTLPAWTLPLPVIAVWGGLIIVWFIQNMMLRVAGWLTYSQKFTVRIISLRNLMYGLIFLLSVPVMLTVAMADDGALFPLSVLLFTFLAVLVIFLLIRTYMLFVGQKISILYWFLYLCAVEILPVSFLVILTARNVIN